MSGQIVFAMLICELHIPAARSLKEKRKVVKSLTERLAKRFRISVAESDYHDLHQRAQLAMALVDSSASRLDRTLLDLRSLADSYLDASVVRWEVELLEMET